MDRRHFLTMLAAGTATALGGVAIGEGAARAVPILPGVDVPLPPLPMNPIGPQTLKWLPGPDGVMVLTVDDGRDAGVVGSWIQFARDTGLRFTFFVTASYPSWSIHRDALRPLVDSGQIQLANHTWDHPDLVKLPAGAIADQLNRTSDFLRNTYGVDGRPYYRAPYGNQNPLVDQVAGDLGYKIALNWSGQLEEYPQNRFDEKAIVELARTHFKNRGIVLCHANAPAITHVYGQLVDIIKERSLRLVTLNDVLIPLV